MSEGILNPIQQLQADFDFDVYTKQEVDTLLGGKADKVDTYTKTETDALLNEKADVATTYTKTETNNLLNGKADKSTTLAGYGITDAYTKAQTDNLLNGKADTNSVYTKEETDNLLSAKANSADVYTKTESNTLLAGKANADDVYTKTEIDNQLTVTKDGTWVKGTQTTATNLEKLEGGIEYLYGLLSYKYSQLRKYINGNYYDYETDTDSAYTKTVPAGAMPYAGIEKVGGKTVVWNQLVDSGTTSVPTINGHKYYTLINGTANIITSSGSAVAIVNDTADMVCDLTLMFGSGNEPSTTADFTLMFGATHYAYNAGELLSAGVTEVVSKKADTSTIATYPIPAEIQALEGFGWSAGDKKNYIDFERKVYVQEVSKLSFAIANMNNAQEFSGWNNSGVKAIVGSDLNTVLTYSVWPFKNGSACGANTLSNVDTLFLIDSVMPQTQWKETYPDLVVDFYIARAVPIETDISEYITDDNLIQVESGGTLTFPNSNGDNYRIPVPSTEEYMINLQEAVSNG